MSNFQKKFNFILLFAIEFTFRYVANIRKKLFQVSIFKIQGPGFSFRIKQHCESYNINFSKIF